MRDFAGLNAEYSRLVTEQIKRLPSEEIDFRLRDNEHQRAKYARVDINRLSIKSKLKVVTQHKKAAFMTVATLGLLIISWFTAVAILPQTLSFDYSKTASCINSPSLFPNLLSGGGSTFSEDRPASISLGSLAIYSSRLCVSPKASPLGKQTYKDSQRLNLFGMYVAKKVYIKTPNYPKVYTANLNANQSQALPLLSPLDFKLAAADTTFTYELSANGKSAQCNKQKMILSCRLGDLGLDYGKSYNLNIVRQFHGQAVGNAFKLPIKTITATAVTQTSILAGSVVYDTPQQIIVNVSKPLKSIAGVSLSYQQGGKPVNVPVTSTFNGTAITVAFKGPLPRQTSFSLSVSNVTSTDQSQLEKAYSLPFATSGGPKVIGVNIPSNGVGFQPAITVTFDQTLLPSQNAQQLISLLANNTTQTLAYSIHGNQISITPQTTLPVCAHLTVATTNSAQNQFGIAGNSAWSFSARTTCYTTFSIGSSARSRAITAYQFGTGPQMILYIGAMHGNEQNSMILLQKWFAALNASPDKIPAKDTIVVIPSINPDGVAANTRVNANGIDLNRNFPTQNWQTSVTEPTSNGALTSDGGPTPLSEPESQALANFESAKRPRLTITYHSHAGIVEANDAADSDALGNIYAKDSGYRATPTYAIGNTFDYSTSGAFEDWANQKLSLPVLVVELTSATSDEFSRNQSAMWAITQL